MKVLNGIVYPREQPPSCKQMGIDSPEECTPIILINDGRILENNLHKLGKNTVWLTEFLYKQNVSDAKDVYLLSYDKTGHFYLAPMEETK